MRANLEVEIGAETFTLSIVVEGVPSPAPVTARYLVDDAHVERDVYDRFVQLAALARPPCDDGVLDALRAIDDSIMLIRDEQNRRSR